MKFERGIMKAIEIELFKLMTEGKWRYCWHILFIFD
jgi:hypothetical protein